jgi:hypothetical protein
VPPIPARQQIFALLRERSELTHSIANDDFWLDHMSSLISCEEQQRIVGDQLCAVERIEAIDRQLAALRASLTDNDDS